jgi:alkanesulfonate monooxygenase SsuD/methylene tetrahydromethanopterin reductase-like flavin-dependent oxidoreductase (luciferase family)
MMKVGLLLPLGKPYASDEANRIEQALALGYSSLWLQEWPEGCGPRGHVDHGSGHDPLHYGSYLARLYSGIQIGLAVLRADYRHPSVTARAVVSAQMLGSGHPFLLGMGMETDTPDMLTQLAQTWQTVYSCLHGEQPDAFLLPPDFSPPRMFLASGKQELWEQTHYQADGWLTTRFDPRQIAAIADPIRQSAPHIEIIIQLFSRIDQDVCDTLRQGQRGAIEIGKNRLQEFVRHWKEVGVSQVIYAPAETPSVNQLRIVAEAVGEEGQ